MSRVELTTLMLATPFGFHLEDRRKLTRWSDVVFATSEPVGVVGSRSWSRDGSTDALDIERAETQIL